MTENTTSQSRLIAPKKHKKTWRESHASRKTIGWTCFINTRQMLPCSLFPKALLGWESECWWTKIGAMDLNKNGLAELRTILFVNRSPGPQSPTGHRVKALTMSMAHRCMWNRKMWPIDGKQCIRWYYNFSLEKVNAKSRIVWNYWKAQYKLKALDHMSKVEDNPQCTTYQSDLDTEWDLSARIGNTLMVTMVS